MTSEYRLGAWALIWRYLLALGWVLPSFAAPLVGQDLSRELPRPSTTSWSSSSSV